MPRCLLPGGIYERKERKIERKKERKKEGKKNCTGLLL
jgi:hypothetical protein